MNLSNIQKNVMTSHLLLPVILVLCIIAWFTANYSTTNGTDTFVILKNWDVQRISPFIQRIVNVLIYVISGFLLIDLNNRSDILRVRPSILIGIYFLFISIYPHLFVFAFTNMSLITFILSLYFLFNSYQCRQSSDLLFYSFAIFGIGTLFFPQSMYLVPIFFIGAGMMQSLNIRSFFAALVGLAFPYFFLLTYAAYMGDISIFYAPFLELSRFGSMNLLQELDISQIAVLAFIILLYAICVIHSLIIDYDNIIRARTTQHFIILLNTALLIFVILQPLYMTPLIALALPGISLMVCHFFLRSSSRLAGITFILTMILVLALYAMEISL